MNKIKMNIWGREFELEIYIRQYQGKEVTDMQKDACERFLKSKDIIERALTDVKHFIENEYKERLNESSIQNVFKYVIPKMIYVPNNGCDRCVALLCNFRFEEEHGLAIIFENEKLSKIALQDDIL